MRPLPSHLLLDSFTPNQSAVPDNLADLERRFGDELWKSYHAARALKPPYNPAIFRSMLAEAGGKHTADTLLATAKPSDGFTELFLRGKENLKLTVEYIVLQSPWRELFSPEQLTVARKRLLRAEVELPSDDVETELPDTPLPEEIENASALFEGVRRTIQINTYERSAKARAACIAHYGARCAVCELDLGAIYGTVASGFIHVHHLRSLASIKSEYVVDPVVDLRPVCPNCHAVIHLGGETRTIEAVRELVAAQRRIKHQ